MSFTSSQLAKYVCGELVGNPEVCCSGAEIDSRQCVLGKVFFALKGESVDGHDYLENAVDGGCSAVVVERACDLPVPSIIVNNVRHALYLLAKARRAELNVECVAAVTGSVGKTTTKDILAHILGDETVSSRNSFNNDLGVPLTILDAEHAKFLVAEVGANDVGEIEPLANLIQPDVAILTSIEKAHLEGFGNQETVLREKAKLLQTVSEGGVVIVPDTVDLSEIHISATICTVGNVEADFPVEVGVNYEGFATLEIGGHDATLTLLGRHNGMNAALAIVAASHILQHKSVSELLDLAAEVTASNGRLKLHIVDDIVFYDDSYNANPASMRSALNLFAEIDGTRKVLVLGSMFELGEQSHYEHKLLGAVIAKTGADVVILVGKEMESTSKTAGYLYEQVADGSAIERIASLIHGGDTVLIKGSRGLKLERVIERVRQTKVSTP